MKRAPLVSLFVLLSLVLSPSVAGLEAIGSETSRTVTVAMEAYDDYRVVIPNGRTTATIAFTVGAAYSDVDFYVLSQTGYNEYIDPNSPGFHYIDQSENAKSFSYSADASGLYFVVDNAMISTTGASPTGSVTYDLTVSFQGTTGPSTESLILAGIAGAAVFGAIAATIIVTRRRRARQGAFYPQGSSFQSPPSMAPPLPPPPPDAPTAAPFGPTSQGPAGVQTPGMSRRPMSESERDALLREFTNQRNKLIGVSIFMIALASAYLALPNLMTMVLTFLPFLGLAIASSLRKLGRAINAGQIVEFQGVPEPSGTVRTKNQTLHQVRFGTAVVGMSQGLYARFVPNRPNSLAVLEGANVAVAVNGAPTAAFERVRIGGSIA